MLWTSDSKATVMYPFVWPAVFKGTYLKYISSKMFSVVIWVISEMSWHVVFTVRLSLILNFNVCSVVWVLTPISSFLSIQRSAFFNASFPCFLAGSPFRPSSLHLPNSLSSGSIKSLLICSFLLIWIHTGQNCWLGSAKETRLNEVYKTHPASLSQSHLLFSVHACVFMSAFWPLCVRMCISLIIIRIFPFFFQNSDSPFPLGCTHHLCNPFPRLCSSLVLPLCSVPEPIFKAFTPADTAAPVITQRFKPHIIAVGSWVNNTEAKFSRVVLNLYVCVFEWMDVWFSCGEEKYRYQIHSNTWYLGEKWLLAVDS